MMTKSRKFLRDVQSREDWMTHIARKTKRADRGREGGYALVALLAMMTLMLLVMMAAAPNVQQQSRRERELETIARGEEVAEAIRMYIHYANRPPTSIEELQEGAPFGTKKVQVLRASAARDLLSEKGEWRLIKANDRALIDFVKNLTTYADGRLPNATTDTHPMMQQLANTLPRITNILNTGTSEDAPGGEDSSLTSNGPFIGVASRSRRESIIAYYGIERHDEWVFTPFFK
jgi:type II secretory pathway pseudopilin PulG